MNLKIVAALLFVVGCTCAVPLESPPDNSTQLVSDALVPAEDSTKKSKRDEPAMVSGTNTTEAPLLGKNETLLVGGNNGTHPKTRAAVDEKKMKVSMGMSMSTATEAKNNTHLVMPDKKNVTEAAIKKRAIASMSKHTSEEVLKKDDKDLKEDRTEQTAELLDGSKINSTIPAQNDTALMEAILQHGLLDEENVTTTTTTTTTSKPGLLSFLKNIAMREAPAENATVVASNSTTAALNKTAHAEHKEHTRHTGAEDCDEATHSSGIVLTERSAKPENNTATAASKNETVSPKSGDKMRRRRSAYGSSAPSQIRLAVRNKPARTSYEAPAAPPVRSSYEAPAAPPARSSYEAPAAPPVRSSYEAPAAPPARSSYEAPAAPPAPSSYEAPAAPPARSSYEAPAAPVRSSYKAPAVRTAVRSSYAPPAAPAAPSSYEAPAAPPAPSSYEAPAAPVRSSYKAPAVRTAARSSYSRAVSASSSYETPAAPPARSSYETPAAPPARSSYETPAAPPARSSYEAPAAAPASSSYETPAAAPARSSYAPAVRTAVRSTYKASATPTKSSSY